MITDQQEQELDVFCLKIYGSKYSELPTDLQRELEYLYKKGGLNI